mmetsp:Transcript_24218/g.65628  ORF Transcript_24218/g.65628 Transcript_24218/m.65628 type:complete len:270 (-) Transcript_24218:396-1205(-)
MFCSSRCALMTSSNLRSSMRSRALGFCSGGFAERMDGRESGTVSRPVSGEVPVRCAQSQRVTRMSTSPTMELGSRAGIGTQRTHGRSRLPNLPRSRATSPSTRKPKAPSRTSLMLSLLVQRLLSVTMVEELNTALRLNFIAVSFLASTRAADAGPWGPWLTAACATTSTSRVISQKGSSSLGQRSTSTAKVSTSLGTCFIAATMLPSPKNTSCTRLIWSPTLRLGWLGLVISSTRSSASRPMPMAPSGPRVTLTTISRALTPTLRMRTI